MKKIFLPILLFVGIFLLASTKCSANGNISEFVNYIDTKTNIETIKTTIIPNSSMVTTDENLKLVSNEIYDSIENSEIPFVIGEMRAISNDDYNWLLKIVQCEAGGEDIVGKILVANVIFNRYDTGKYNNLKQVIFARGQFQPVSSGAIYNAKASQETIDAVKQALDGIDYSDGAMYFMNRRASDKSNVSWFDRKLTFIFEHGGHEFFKS